MHAPVAGDEAIAGNALRVHAEVCRPMGDELVGLFEGAFIQQKIDTLARRELAGLALACAPLRASAFFGDGMADGKLGQLGLVRVGLRRARRDVQQRP